MRYDSADIEPDQAQHVLHVFDYDGGHQPGSFAHALITAARQADPLNLAKLGIGFPGYAAAVYLIMNEDDGVDRLRGIASR